MNTTEEPVDLTQTPTLKGPQQTEKGGFLTVLISVLAVLILLLIVGAAAVVIFSFLRVRRMRQQDKKIESLPVDITAKTSKPKVTNVNQGSEEIRSQAKFDNVVALQVDSGESIPEAAVVLFKRGPKKEIAHLQASQTKVHSKPTEVVKQDKEVTGDVKANKEVTQEVKSQKEVNQEVNTQDGAAFSPKLNLAPSHQKRTPSLRSMKETEKTKSVTSIQSSGIQH